MASYLCAKLETDRSRRGAPWVTEIYLPPPLPRSKTDLMFFFDTNVACIINSTQRKHNTNKVKDSDIFFYKLISRGYTTLYQGYETVMRDDV